MRLLSVKQVNEKVDEDEEKSGKHSDEAPKEAGTDNVCFTPDVRNEEHTGGAEDPEQRMRFQVTRYDSLGNVQAEQPSSCRNEESVTSGSVRTPSSPRSSSPNQRLSFYSLMRKISQQNSVLSDADIVVDPGVDAPEQVARRGRLFAKRYKRRLVYKGGGCNISYRNISRRRQRFLMDFFTTMIDLKWRYIFLMFSFAFVAGWVIFALIWWIICIVNGDNLHKDDENWNNCVDNVYDFQTALLFSIETQHTIGYGLRCMTPHCPIAVCMLMAQSCFGVMVSAMMAGLVFAKMSRPIKRCQTIMFSKNAVICQRDGQRYLLFRVADTRKSMLVGTTIRAVLVKKKVTAEGEILPFYQHHLTILPESEDDYLFLCWPLTVMHKIDEDSPFYKMSAEELLKERFELIVILEGTVEPTGMSTQVRTSYLPSEILWGHQLAALMTYQRDNGHYLIDYTLFHETVPTNMAEDSAEEHERRRQSGQLVPSVSVTVAEDVASMSSVGERAEEDSGNGSAIQDSKLEPLTSDYQPKASPPPAYIKLANPLDTNFNVCNGDIPSNHQVVAVS